MEYIQDFVNIHGLKIFQEEFNRLINKYIDLESNSFLSKKMSIDELLDDDNYIPLPQDGPNNNFMGRLTQEILNLTDPKRSIYVDLTPAFYDLATYKESFGLKTCWLLKRCIGISGLNGIDKLMSFMVVFEMKKLIKVFQRQITAEIKKGLTELFTTLKNLNTFVDNSKVYAAAKKK
jgi:WASH complex subunit strumpellin